MEKESLYGLMELHMKVFLGSIMKTYTLVFFFNLLQSTLTALLLFIGAFDQNVITGIGDYTW